MTLREEQDKVQKAMNTTLSGLQEDPWLTQRVLANAKGEEPVKRKISLALVLCIVAILSLMGTAYALFSSRVAGFFGQHWGHDYENWLQGGKIAQIGETVTLGGVDFTLDEVVCRDRGIYGVGTARVRESKDVLLPMDLVDGWDLEAIFQGDEAQSLIRQARNAGGRMLSVDCYPERIGVDNGSMMNAGDVGVYNLRNEDGSITFSFETSGYALTDGVTYQLELSVDVDEWTETGKVKDDETKPQIWTVSFEPMFLISNTEPDTSANTLAEAAQQSGYEILVPESYLESGTLPVYQAIENDFTTLVQPEWFNQSGIMEKTGSTKTVSLTFNDHAQLSYSHEGIWYGEYTDELFDYNWRERETDNPNLEPSMLPKPALSQSLADIASGVYFEYGYSDGIALEHEQLSHLSLEDAKQTAKDLFDKLGIQGYELAWALDLNLERIHTLGEAYNKFWFEGEGYSNSPRQDYSAATVEDEGYCLIYTPLGVTKISDGRHQATLYISSRGIVFASIISTYHRGDLAYTPDRLITPEEVITRLYTEAGKSPDTIRIQSIERVALTYGAVRAENKQDGMVFIPVWQILFKEVGESKDNTSWAEFNAVNGTLINAVFR